MTPDYSLLDALPQALLRLVTDSGQIAAANTRALALLGYPAHALIGTPIQEIAAAGGSLDWSALFAGQHSGCPLEAVLTRADGQETAVEVVPGGIQPATDDALGATLWISLRPLSKPPELERPLHEALAYAHLGYWSCDPLTGHGQWSDEVYRLFGIEADIPAGLETLRARLHPEDAEATIQGLLHSLEDGEDYQADYRILRPDGETRWVHCQGKPVRGGAEQAVRLEGFLQDVTEQHLAAEALRASEQKLASIFRTVPVGIGLTRQRVFQEVNQGFCALLGYAREELIGQNARLVYAEEAEFDRVGREEQRATSQTRSNEIETRLRHKDGHVIDVFLCSSLLDQENPEAGVVFTVADISDRKAAEQRAQEADKLFTKVFQAAGTMMTISDVQTGVYDHVNDAFVEITGYTREQASGCSSLILGLISAEERERLLASLSPEGHIRNLELKLKRNDGRRFDALYNGELIEVNGQQKLLSTAHDITPLKDAERALREERRFLEHIMDGIEDLIFVVDRNRRILRMNRAARERARTLGVSEQDCHCFELLYRSRAACGADTRNCPLKQVWTSGRSSQALHHVEGMDGRERILEIAASPLFGEDGQIQAVIEVLRDVTDHRELVEQLRLQDLRYAHLAHYDPLTDLPNRFLFSDRLKQATQVAGRTEAKLAVLLLDLDEFKQVNDSFDHSHGDDVLVALGKRLQAFVEDADTIARLGGDEFGILLTSVDHDEDPAKAAQALLELCQDPFEVQDHRVFLTASIGISLFPEHGLDTDTLIRNADTALFRAKAEGRNSYQYYSQNLTTMAFERILLESSLHDAIAHDELVLHYQPQLDLATGAICGVEALVRWQHPSMGLVPPDRFIALAESTGLIIPMGAWVLQTACAQMAQWLEAGTLPPDALMCVNVSARQLADTDLVAQVQSACETVGLAAQNLELEITESSVMSSPEESAARLKQLRALGVKLAIDDFGTGYSSLSYLKRLPLTKLKIDRSFVSDIPQDDNDMAITRAIIALTRSLGLEVLAEGIETEHQRAFLVQEGCPQGQGYLFSRPLTGADVQRFAAARSGASAGNATVRSMLVGGPTA